MQISAQQAQLESVHFVSTAQLALESEGLQRAALVEEPEQEEAFARQARAALEQEEPALLQVVE